MMTEADYSGKWRRHQRNERLFALAWLGGVPLVVALSLAIGLLSHASSLDAILLGVALLWVVAVIFTGVRWSGLRCPRCDAPFFRGRLLWRPFAQQCGNCGLPKGFSA